MIAAGNFTDTISLGNLLTLAILFAGGLALLFTLRAKIVGVWKDNYEGEKEKRLHVEEQLAAEQKANAGCQAELAVAHQMADLSPVLLQLTEIHSYFDKREATFETMLQSQEEQRDRAAEAVAQVRADIARSEEQILDQLRAIANAQTVSAGIQERMLERLSILEGKGTP